MSEDEPEKLASSDTIMAEATLWFGRMRGPEAEQHKAEFERWLARGALHRSFYNRAGEIYAMGKFLKDEQEENARQSESRGTDGNDRHRWMRRAAVASIAIAAVVAIGFLMQRPRSISGMAPEYAQTGDVGTSFRLATNSGQSLTQVLVDGSTVTLSPDTTLLVDYDRRQRTFKLERGQSRFEVAHEKRPFVVLAGDGRITARGTIFEVGLKPDHRVTVRLLRGKIDVEAPGSASKKGVLRHLNAGESLTYPAATPVTMRLPVAAPQIEQPVAAKPTEYNGAYEEFDSVALAAVIDLANQHGARTIRLASPDLAGLKVSGRLRLNDAEKLARKVALLFNLETETGPGNEIILRRP